MKILALDYSTTHCGYCIGDFQGHVIKSGVITRPKKEKSPERIVEIAKALKSIIGKQAYQIVVEDSYMSSNAKSVLTLTRGAGYLLGYLRADLSQVNWFAANEWRKLVYDQVPRKRTELKLKAKVNAQKRMKGTFIKSEDESEAILIYFAYLENLRKI